MGVVSRVSRVWWGFSNNRTVKVHNVNRVPLFADGVELSVLDLAHKRRGSRSDGKVVGLRVGIGLHVGGRKGVKVGGLRSEDDYVCM